jgi:hypothetical protein
VPTNEATPENRAALAAVTGVRDLVVERHLVRAAFDHLTADAFMALPFEALGPTKQLLKRYFSSQPWTAADDAALAEVVGPGEGWWRHDLDADVTLEYGWVDGRFRVGLVAPGAETGATSVTGVTGPAGPVVGDAAGAGTGEGLEGSFDGPVVPEATPNPRTIRFQVGPIHDGPSRWYVAPSDARRSGGQTGDEPSGAAPDDPGVDRLFAEVAEVANVLVGPEFVAVGLRRAGDWERLLRPVLAIVTDEFAPFERVTPGAGAGESRAMGGPAGAGSVGGTGGDVAPGRTGGGGTDHRVSRLEQAWHDLGSLRPTVVGDLARVRAAAGDGDPSRRQVAANLLREADPDTAAAEWSRLVGDPVRSVRRAAVDAMVDVDREGLRPLLERALADADPWVRWKALRGLAQLGAAPSRHLVAVRADDPDFRVRLEAASILRAIA